MTESNNTTQSMAERLSALMDGTSVDGTSVDDATGNGQTSDHSCLEHMCKSQELKSQLGRYHLIRDVIQDDYRSPLSADFASNLSKAIAAEPALDCTPISAELTGQNLNTESQKSSNVVSLADRKQAQDEAAQTAADSDASQTAAPASGWRRATTGFAIAASVAMISLVGLNTLQNSDSSNGNQTAQNATQIPAVQQSAESAGSVILAEQPVLVVPAGENQLEFVSNTGTFWVNSDATSGSGMSSAGEQRLNMFLSEHIEHSPTSEVRGMIPYSRLAGYDAVRPSAEAGAEQ